MVRKGDCQMNGLDLCFGVLPKRSYRLKIREHAIEQLEYYSTYPLELATHEQHTSPDSPLCALLSRETIEMAFSIAQKNFRESTEAAVFFFVNLNKVSNITSK